MPENEAREWLRALAARGATVTVRNNRLWLHPASAYKELSDDELLTLRRRRQEIKDLVKAGDAPAAEPPAPRAAEPAPGPPRRPAPEHVRRIVEWNTPEERARRDAEATAVMRRTIGTTSPLL